MLIHYEGRPGEFNYDNNMFEIKKIDGLDCLHYKGLTPYVTLPEGCIDTSYMFYECELPEGFCLKGFDTSNVIDMYGMFENCKLPENFTLGDKFNISNVTHIDDETYNIIIKYNTTLAKGGRDHE